MSQSVAVIDYGMGNLHSVASALQFVSPNDVIHISSDEKQILAADRVIFPGVGAMGDCMAEIRARHLQHTIAKVIAQKQPLLGICVGMQALTNSSEENGGAEGLHIFDASVKRFAGRPFQHKALKVPHMGWSFVEKTQDHPLWHGIASNSRFYFVHSYYVDLQGEEVIGRCDYGLSFAAMLARENIAAVQFHPEKSQHTGLKLLKNFLQWTP